MANLSDLVGTNNLKFATVALTGVGTVGGSVPVSQTFTQNIWHKIPYNAVFSNPFGIITLNNSLSSITLQSGIYQITPLQQSGASSAGAFVSTRLRAGTSTYTKWPMIYINTPSSTIGEPGQHGFVPTLLRLTAQTNITFEQYFSNTVTLNPQYGDGEFTLFHRLDITKLK